MASATYTFEIDTKRTGTFAASIDNITNYVTSMRWNDGFRGAYDEVAPPAKLNVNLRNINAEFSSEALGGDIVTNGNFATWSGGNPSNWTVTGESGSDPEISEVSSTVGHGGGGTGSCNIYCSSAGATVDIRQTNLVIGNTYRVTIDVTYVATGGVQILNGSTAVSPPYQSIGQYTVYFNATDTALIIRNWYATNATIDSVTCKQTALYAPLIDSGMLCRLKASFNGTTYTLFLGRLIKPNVTVGSAGSRTVTLEFVDPTEDLYYADFKPTLQENVTINTALMEIFNTAKTAYPYSRNYWMLGVTGSSELGTSTYIFSPPTTTFDTGDTTLSFVGDIADVNAQGITVNTHIQQLMPAEAGGRFFFDPRTGAYTFHRRNRDTLNTTIAATFTESDFDIDNTVFVLRSPVENDITINFQPREVGTAGSVVWTATNVPFSIPVGGEYRTTARYQDATDANRRMGARDVLAMTYGLDIIANLESDGSGLDGKNRISYSVSPGANQAEVVITNQHGDYTVYITTLQLRGTPITFYDTRSVRSINGDSIRTYMLMQNTLSIPAIDDDDFAQSYADYRTSKMGTSAPQFTQIGFIANGSAVRMTRALSLTIGNRITITDSWQGHNADYIVVGTSHEVAIGGEHTHKTALILKPQARTIFWVLGTAGYSELGQTTRPAF